jgi:hypothetical protein
MSVTMSAVMRSPSHVPHAAAFITLKRRVVAHIFSTALHGKLAAHDKRDLPLKWYDQCKNVRPNLLNDAVLTENVT